MGRFVKMIERIEKKTEILGKEVYSFLNRTECGIEALVTGGDRTHIGAVTIVDEKGYLWNRCFEGHRDDTISKEWAVALHKKYSVPVVVSVGIHYDKIDPDGIRCVVEGVRKQLYEILESMT